jgi:hypothetical protein
VVAYAGKGAHASRVENTWNVAPRQHHVVRVQRLPACFETHPYWASLPIQNGLQRLKIPYLTASYYATLLDLAPVDRRLA